MPEDKRFDIIMTVWNRKGYTARTLASLIDSGAVNDCERLIIVDNCSTEEGMYEALDSIYKDTPAVSGKVWLLRRAKNDGWASGVNDALGLSRSPYLLLINNDVEFTMDFHHKMLALITTPVWMRPDGKGEKGIGLLGAWRHTSHGFVAPEHNGIQASGFREMDNVPAVAWMLSKRAMIEVGMLKENGPCMTKGGNGEDTDYVNRMKEQGWLVGVPTEDVATHLDGY